MKHVDIKRETLILAGAVLGMVALILVVAFAAVSYLAPAQPGPTGYTPDPEATKAFLDTLDEPTIRDAAPELFEQRRVAPDPEGVMLYRPFRKAFSAKYGREWACEKQGIGDCVSWGWGHGVGFATAVEYILGNIDEWDMPSTEAIYGGSRCEARGKTFAGYSDGSYGGAAAKFVHQWGILFRREYPFANLTTYDASRAKEWGAYGCGGKGDNGVADTEAKKFPVVRVAQVKTYAEAKASINAGYPVPVCSMQGFASTRDADGFARPQGTWAHCMVFIATRSDREGLLVLNSWGEKWISGGLFPPDQPAGSFWCDSQTCDRMLSGGDSFAVSAVDGFKAREIDNSSWLTEVQPRKREPERIYGPEFALAP